MVKRKSKSASIDQGDQSEGRVPHDSPPRKANKSEVLTNAQLRKEKAQKTSHIRDRVLPAELNHHEKYLKIITWNVNGLRAVLNSKKDVLLNLVAKHQPDVLCLQVLFINCRSI